MKVKGLFCFFLVLGITLFGMAKNSVADLNDGLVAYYPFNGNANDESGNGNNGTVNGATLTNDRNGNTNKAYSFDGVDDYIEFPQTFLFHQSNDASLSFWIRQNSSRHETIFWSRGDDTDSNRFNIYTNWAGKTFGIDYRSSSGYIHTIFNENTNVNQWVHIVITSTGIVYNLYIDGKYTTTHTDSNPDLPTYTGKWFLARRSGYMYSGSADDIRMYNRVLSESEIQELYNEGNSATTTPTPSPTPTATATPSTTPTLQPFPSVFPTLPPLPTVTPTQPPTQGGNSVVFGFVNDEDENALEGVIVTISGADYSNSTETDDAGFFEFRDLAAGDYTITYEKEGYQTQTRDISLGEDEVKEVETIIMEIIEKAKISGYVVDIQGEPIESVKLRLKGIKTGYSSTTSSDADGFFEFGDLEADTYILIAKKRGYKRAKQTVKLEEGEETEIEIEMKKTSKRRLLLKEAEQE